MSSSQFPSVDSGEIDSNEFKKMIQEEDRRQKEILPISQQDPAYDKEGIVKRIRTLCWLGYRITQFIQDKVSIGEAESIRKINNQILRFERALDTFLDQEGSPKDPECNRVNQNMIDLFRDFFVRYHHKIISKNNVNGYCDDKWLLGKVDLQQNRVSDHIRIYIGSNRGKKTSIHYPLSEVYGICHIIEEHYPEEFKINQEVYDPKEIFSNYLYLIFYGYQWDKKTRYQIRKVMDHIRERMGYGGSFDIKNIPDIFKRYTGPLKEVVFDRFSDNLKPEAKEKINGFIDRLETSLEDPKTTETISSAFDKIRESSEGGNGLLGGISSILSGLGEVGNDPKFKENFKDIFGKTMGVDYEQFQGDIKKEAKDYINFDSEEKEEKEDDSEEKEDDSEEKEDDSEEKEDDSEEE